VVQRGQRVEDIGDPDAHTACFEEGDPAAESGCCGRGKGIGGDEEGTDAKPRHDGESVEEQR
jgi:hypothetical protein